MSSSDKKKSDPVVRQQLINFIIYTILGIMYGWFAFGRGVMQGILVIPIILMSIVVFLCNLAFTFLGQFIFRKEISLLSLLTPQMIALILFVIIKIKREYILDYDLDQALFIFFIITTILNAWTFLKLRRSNFKAG